MRKLWPVLATVIVLVLASTLCLAETKAAPKGETKQTAPEGKVNLNAATQAELEKLPGIGTASAKKIIAGRPYASVNDLTKAGLNAKTIEKISPLVNVGAAAPAAALPVSPATPAAQKATPTNTPAPPQAGAAAKAAKPATPPPAGKDMVWVNMDSKIFHKPGSKWYGNTKQGSYMTEAEAIKAGYREAK